MSPQRIQKRGSNISSATTSAIKRIQKHGNGSKLRRHEQVERALRESEEKFRNLFDNARDMIVLVDTETGTILDINTAGCNLLGLPKEKIIGRHQSELHPPELADKYKRLFQDHVQRGGNVNDYIVVQRADGAQIPMDVSASAAKLADKTIIQGIFRDVTERARIEKTLQESEEKFSKAFHASPEAIGIVTEKDGKFIDVNESYVRMTGYSREELIGTTTNTHNWVRPEDHTKMQKIMQEQGRIYNEEFDYRTKSGEIRTRLFSIETITINGELCRIGVSTDITERKRAEEALQKERAFLSSILTGIQDGITVLDNKLNIISANKTAEKWFAHGMPLIGKKCYEACHNRSKPCEACPTMQTLETGKAANQVVPRHSPDGMITGWSELHTFPIFDTQKGEITGIIEYGRDVTARKQAEEALRESEEKFSKAFHAIPEAVAICTLKDGIFLEVNDSFISFNEYTREEVIGHETKELNIWVNPGDRYRIKQLVEKRGHFENEEFLFRSKSGEMRNVLLSADVINFGGKPCMLTIGNDITKRKKMENALKESEEKFSKAFHASPEAIAIATAKDEKLIDINESYTQITGYSREELIGNTSTSVHIWASPEDHTKMRKMMQQQGRIYNEEFDYRTKSGEIRTRLFSLEPITINGEPCTIGVSIDITERKMMENALREREKRFSDIALNTLEWIWEVDVNGKYTYSSPVVEKILGYKPEEILEKYFYSFFLPEEREELKKAALEVFAQKQPFNGFINRNIHKNGKTVDFLTSGVPIIDKDGNLLGYRGVDTDITERKAMERVIRESEEKFSKAFHAIPEQVTIVRMKDGIFIDVNESFCRNNGYTREEVIGRKREELNLLIGQSQREQFMKIVKEQGHAENIELECRDKSGETRTLLFSSDIINLGGEPCQLTIVNDITKRKQGEQKLQQAMAELESSGAKLQATNKELESFSYSVSHDLRSPLRSIDGFSQALLEDYLDRLDEKGQDYLHRLRSASQKMGELIDGLLKLSRLTRWEMHHEKVDLSSLANEIAARLQETNPERNVKFIIGSDLKANGDPQMLRVLVENLFGNAFKFTKNTKQALVEFGSITEGERKTFFIKDNGAGFDMAFKDKLFGAFQRLHDAAEFPGTGIGLATVQRIINRHGGSIRAEGAVGEGAIFYFSLN